MKTVGLVIALFCVIGANALVVTLALGSLEWPDRAFILFAVLICVYLFLVHSIIQRDRV